MDDSSRVSQLTRSNSVPLPFAEDPFQLANLHPVLCSGARVELFAAAVAHRESEPTSTLVLLIPLRRS